MAKYRIKTSSGQLVGPFEGTRVRQAYAQAFKQMAGLSFPERKKIGHLTLQYNRTTSDGRHIDNNVCDEDDIMKRVYKHAQEFEKSIFDGHKSEYIDETSNKFHDQEPQFEVTKPFIAFLVLCGVGLAIILYTVFAN